MKPNTRRAPRRLPAALLSVLLLGGCSLPLPDKPVASDPWDLGPAPGITQGGAATGPALGIGEVAAPATLASTHMLYRLLYAGSDEQPFAYARARWAMPPPQLVDQRLRAALAARYPVLATGTPLTDIELHTELTDFSQLFDTPEDSHAAVQLRATLLAPRHGRLLGQRTFAAQAPAPTADAAGGVRALRVATDQLIEEVRRWVAERLASLRGEDGPARTGGTGTAPRK